MREVFMGWLNRLTALFNRSRTERDLDEELQHHIEVKTQENVAAGMSPEEARYAALRAFGGVEQKKEECRDADRLRWIEDLIQDVRYGLRQLRRNPGFTAVAVITLALGIGANTAIFSVVDGVLLAPLPYAQPNRLVAIWESNLHYGWHVWISYLNFRDWQRDARAFRSVAAFYIESHNLTNPGPPEHIEGDGVSSGFFTTLGVNLALGREFTSEEDRRGGAPVAIISHRLWLSRFRGSSRVLGKPLTLDGVDYTVVGVLPPDIELFGHPEVYTPLAQVDPVVLKDRGTHDDMLAIGRLKPGITLARAQAEMSGIQDRLDRLYPKSDQGLGAALVPLKGEIVGNVKGTMLLLLGAVGLVLLIACANVANLLLARAATRGREFAIRWAMGASRARLARQLLTESVLLSLAGAGLGLPIAAGGVKAALAAVPGGLPRSGEIGLNLLVLLFALAVAVAVGVLFGLAPALKGSQCGLEEGLKEGGRTSSSGQPHVQGTLVIFQMALTLVLLVGAGLLFRTVGDMWNTNPGFDTEDMVTFKVGISPSLTGTASGTRTAYRQLLERIQRVPGIEAADFAESLPLSGQTGQIAFWIDGQKPAVIQSAPRMLNFNTGPDYLRVMKVPLLQGRFFTAEDTIKSPDVVVIDSIFARTYFRGENPIGHTISCGFNADHVYGPYRIIGVVGHVRNSGLGRPSAYTRVQSYFPLYQDADEWTQVIFPDTTIIVRTPLDPAALMPAIRKAVYGGGRDQPVYAVRTMQQIASDSMSSQRFPMILLGIFAGLALLLASVGIYGVISYSVTQRVHEIGIRMALGAERGDVFRMVIGHGLRLALAGLAIGAAGAMILTRVVSSFSTLIYGVGPSDPVTYAFVCLALTAVALFACYIPARHATKVDPTVALRYE
jgi:putative ABC transport system permease protein